MAAASTATLTSWASLTSALFVKLSDGRLTLHSLTLRCLALLAFGRQQLLADLALDVPRNLGMLIEEGARVLLALADALAVVAVPGARFLDEPLRHADVDDLTVAGDAGPVKDLELGFAERRRYLVLDDLDAGLVADDFLAVLQRADAADVQPHGSVELERVAAGGGFRVAEHHADLHADLVDEDDDGVRALDVAGELAQRLRHEARMQADVHVAHLALDLRLRRQRRDRVDHDDVDRAGAHQHVRDFQRLLAGIRLRHQQFRHVDAELRGVHRIERVLGIHERCSAADALRLGDDLQGERGFARGLRAVDLDDAAARQPADAERNVQPERAGGHRFDVVVVAGVAQAHDRALAELFFDLPERGGERLLAVFFH